MQTVRFSCRDPAGNRSGTESRGNCPVAFGIHDNYDLCSLQSCGQSRKIVFSHFSNIRIPMSRILPNWCTHLFWTTNLSESGTDPARMLSIRQSPGDCPVAFGTHNNYDLCCDCNHVANPRKLSFLISQISGANFQTEIFVILISLKNEIFTH